MPQSPHQLPPQLPPRASLEWLRKTAKDRLKTLRVSQPAARLADAQLAVAREHGFPSWRALKAQVDRSAGAPAPNAGASAERDRALQASCGWSRPARWAPSAR